MTNNLSAEEFYRLRDDRTNRIVDSSSYQHFPVRVVADSETIHTYNGQVQLLLVANMMARWCRKVEFGFSDAPLITSLSIHGYKTLHERIKRETVSADPFGDFTFNTVPSSETIYTLKVGNKPVKNENISFTIFSDGWWISAAQNDASANLVFGQDNIAAATFAACVGVADAFKSAINVSQHLRVKSTTFSLFDFKTSGNSSPTIPKALQIGRTQLVGVGSVGSAFVYLLSMLSVEGFIDIIDCDLIEIANLNRSPLFGISDVNQPKVEIAGRYLSPKVETTPFLGNYDEFVKKYGRAIDHVDLILPLANEFGVRNQIENNFPPIQIYSTTSPNWSINYHRSIPFKDACSSCRFPETSTSHTFVCSETLVTTKEEKQIDAALPFLSVAAASLVVADIIKLQLQGYPFTANFADISLLGNLEFVAVHDFPKQPMCYCGYRSINIHKSAINKTLFADSSFI